MALSQRWQFLDNEKLECLNCDRCVHNNFMHPHSFFQLVEDLRVAVNEDEQRILLDHIQLVLRDYDPWETYEFDGKRWSILHFFMYNAIYSYGNNLMNVTQLVLDLIVMSAAHNISKRSETSLSDSMYWFMNSPFENCLNGSKEIPLFYLVHRMMVVASSVLEYQPDIVQGSKNCVPNYAIMSRIRHLACCLTKLGADPFFVVEIDPLGLCEKKLFGSAVSLAVMFGVHKEDLPPPSAGVPLWERFVFKDDFSGAQVNQLIVEMIQNYCKPSHVQSCLECRNLQCFLIPENTSILELMVLCGRFDMFFRLKFFFELCVPEYLMNVAMSAYTVFTRKGHKAFIDFFYKDLDTPLPLTKYPIYLQLPNGSNMSPILTSFGRKPWPMPPWTNGDVKKYKDYLVPYRVITDILGTYAVHQKGEMQSVRFTRAGNIMVTKLIKKQFI